MNKTLTAILTKVNSGKALTAKEQKIYTNFMNDMGGERPAETVTAPEGDLNDLLNNEGEKVPETSETAPILKLDLNALKEIEDGYNKLSKHEKLKTASDSNIDLFEKLQEVGIYGIFDGKKAKNDIGTHYIEYALPTLDGMDYRNAYKHLSTVYRKNPNFSKALNEIAQGEIITLAGYGGNFLNFIKPYDKPIILDGMDGTQITITKENWADKPLSIWANGGRMIKVFYTLGMINYLKGNYFQKPTDKFQLDDMNIRNKHWLHFEKRMEQIGLITKNGNFKPLPENLQSGWGNLIEWAQKTV